MLHYALYYAGRGFPVFPIGAGTKAPLTGHGFKDATTNKPTVTRWWDKHPDAGIGIPTGAATFDALDVDPRHGGDKTLETIMNGSDLSEGPAAKTGGGGLHYLFKHVAEVGSRIGFLPGLDWKSDGGYIVVPPSIHPSGQRYHWIAERELGMTEFTEPPSWLVKTLQQPQRKRRKRNGPLLEGERNDQLFRAACAMRGEGLGQEEILIELERINQRRCAPPLHSRELRSITDSAVRYPPSITENQNFSDVGNAKRLVRLHGTDIRFCHPWQKWLIWDGTRWKADDTGEIERRAKSTVKSMFAAARDCVDDAQGRAIASWALKSESRARISAMIELAASEPGVPILPAQLNANPWLLNVMNGTVDLRTGELRPHERKNYITQRSPVGYDASARSPTFEKFMSEIMLGRDEDIDYARRAFGYAATGSTREQVLFFLFGYGSNGKSTLLNAIRETLGPDYATESLPELLLAKKGEVHPTERAQLFGKRLVTTVELEEGRRLAESMVKHLTGSDTITARRMREDPWSFNPTHTIFLAVNHKPDIRGTDYAMWRRVRLMTFEAKFEKKKNTDETLPEKLALERAGILAWLVSGAKDWYRYGLDDLPRIRAATDEYRAEMDILGKFVEDYCVIGENTHTVSAGDLYGAFIRWHRGAFGGEPMTQALFGRRLRERGFLRGKDPRTRRVLWRGIGLLTQNQEEEGGE